MSNPLDRFRLIALAEGVSFIALMGVAMPLKYVAGMPTPVTVVGWIHGVLFILYVVAGTHAAIAGRWSYRFIALAFAASLIPGATFWLDRKLRALPTS